MLVFKVFANFARKAKPLSEQTKRILEEQKQIQQKMQKMDELNKYIQPELSAQFDKYLSGIQSPSIEGVLKKIQEDLDSEHCQFNQIKLKTKKNDLKGLLKNKKSDFTKNFNKMIESLEDESEFKENNQEQEKKKSQKKN